MLNKRIANIGIPNQMKHLPVSDEGYPVPWFVHWNDKEPDFRIYNHEKLRIAIEHSRCWACGKPLGKYRTFVIGPMCMINRINSEPPCHHSCAEYSVMACPFLSNPRMRRNEKDPLPEDSHIPGIPIMRNPGVTVLWTTFKYEFVKDPRGSVLFQLGKPEKVEFYAHGRPASREEVLGSINSGLPLLRAADGGDPTANEMIDARYKEALALLPAEV